VVDPEVSMEVARFGGPEVAEVASVGFRVLFLMSPGEWRNIHVSKREPQISRNADKRRLRDFPHA
jgi:hypothetical protein